MTRKIAISLDDRLLADVTRSSRKQGVSRSALFARAVAEYLARESRRLAEEEYVQSYRDVPETDAESAALDTYVHSRRAWSDE